MINQLSQFTTTLTTVFNHSVSFGTQFIVSHQIIISSLFLGLITFLFFTTFVQPIIIRQRQQKKLTKKYTNTAFLNAIENKKIFWHKIPLLLKFYKTYLWANLPFTYEFFLTISFILFLIIIGLGLITGHLLISIFFALFILYLYFLIIRIMAKKNYSRIPNQLPFVLETLSGSIQSGYSLRQAIEFTANEVEMPFKLIFQEITSQLSYNLPLTAVLRNAQTNTTNQEFKTVLDGLILQNKMGGDIVKMLQQMSTWVRQKNKLQKDIKVFTSQGRLSGILIALLWPVSAFIFYILNADYIMILFNTPTGQMLLVLSFLLEIIGFTMIWKIIKIKI